MSISQEAVNRALNNAVDSGYPVGEWTIQAILDDLIRCSKEFEDAQKSVLVPMIAKWKSHYYDPWGGDPQVEAGEHAAFEAALDEAEARGRYELASVLLDDWGNLMHDTLYKVLTGIKERAYRRAHENIPPE